MAPIRLFGVLVTILLVSGPSLVKSQGRYPNTPCEDRMDCDPISGTTLLVCTGEDPNKMCSCPNGKVFHFNENKYLLVATSACTSITRPVEMTPNSECNLITKTVMCETGYSETANKKCAMPLGGACRASQKDDCDHVIFAICTSSKCQCPAGTVVENEECKLDRQSDCVPYDSALPGPPQMPCSTDSKCAEKVLGDPASGYRCTGCPSGMVENKNGNCVAPYEGQCTPEDPSERPCDVDEFLECDPAENKCLCQDTEKTWFNPNSERCELLVRFPCIPHSFAQACTEYSECTYNAYAGFICLCNEDGFVDSPDKRCVRKNISM